MKRIQSIFTAILLLLIAHTTAQSATLPEQPASRLVTGISVAEVLDSELIPFGFVEYRPGWRYKEIGNWIATEISADEFYLGAGIFIDFPVGDRWMITPSTGAGYYSENDGLDLGHSLEFRSTFEVSYRLHHSRRVGMSFGHFSNLVFGEHNPGTEFIKLFVSIPLD